jgi:hypothetical protein
MPGILFHKLWLAGSEARITLIARSMLFAFLYTAQHGKMGDGQRSGNRVGVLVRAGLGGIVDDASISSSERSTRRPVAARRRL